MGSCNATVRVRLAIFFATCLASACFSQAAWAGPLGTFAGGAPIAPIRALDTGIDPFGLARAPLGRTFVGASGMVFELRGTDLVRVAGNGLDGYEGDGGPALDAKLRDPQALAADDSRVWIADAGNYRVRIVDLESGLIATVAGNGTKGIPRDGVLAVASPLGSISAIQVDAAGDLWIADATNFLLLRVDGATGQLARAAGTGLPGIPSDLLAPTDTAIGRIVSIAAIGPGQLYLADELSARVLRFDSGAGTLTTVAGGGLIYGTAGDGLPATLVGIIPLAVAVDLSGSLVIADASCEDACPACAGSPCAPGGIATDTFRRVDPKSGAISSFAGGGSPPDGLGDGLPSRSARFGRTRGILRDAGASLLVADGLHGRLRRIDTGLKPVTTLAGNGAARFSGDGGPATAALLGAPRDIAFDAASGALWIADAANDRVRLVIGGGQSISTAAGGGSPPDGLGDGLKPQDASLSRPSGLDVEAPSRLWIADTGHGRVRLVDLAKGVIVTPPGGDAAESPADVLADGAGGCLVSDFTRGIILHLDGRGASSVFAGGGKLEDDGIAAIDALLHSPASLARDARGNVYIAEIDAGAGAGRVRAVDPAGRITTIVGGTPTVILPVPVGPLPADPAAAAAAELSKVDSLFHPTGLALDRNGDLFVADESRHRILFVEGATRTVSVLAGTGTEGCSPDGTPAHLAELRSPSGLAFDPKGRLFFAEKGNHRVRTLAFQAASLGLTPPSGPLAGGTPVRITGQGLAVDAPRVLFGDREAAALSIVDDATLLATTPPGTTPASTVAVTVETSIAKLQVPGGFTYVNQAPIANAGPSGQASSYSVFLGGSLFLDGAASRDPDEPAGDAVVSYEWDLNGDGSPDATGPRPEISAEELAALGLGAPGSFTVTLRAGDREGLLGAAQAAVNVLNITLEPPSGSLNGGYPARIAGAGFGAVTGVFFGLTPVKDLAVASDVLAFTVPPGKSPAGPVAVTLAFGSSRVIAPGAFTYTNDPPVAVAGGPYKIHGGSSLVLDGSLSFDPNALTGDSIVRYEWDLDDDGKPDRRGAKISLDPGELDAFGLAMLAAHRVSLRVTDQNGGEGVDFVSLLIEPKIDTFPNEEARDWVGDRDKNGIDDAIDAKPDDEKVNIIVVLEHGADLAAAAARLAAVSDIVPVPVPSISALCLRGVRADDVRRVVAAEPALFRAEEEVLLEASLDTSCAAIRACPSALYSPDTAHDRGLTGAGVNIAFLDSGIDDDHPALSGKFVAGFNVLTDSISGVGSQSNPDDDFEFGGIFHGTHMAGIALGADPALPGVAPGAKLIDVKVLNGNGQGSTAEILLGLQWCINHRTFAWPGQPASHYGIDVVNLSISSRTRSDGRDVLSIMVNAAVAQGLVVVAAAGNSSAFGPGFGSPAAADDAITIAASDDHGTIDRSDDTIYAPSNFGPRLDDGDSDLLEELKPDATAPGAGILSASGNAVGQPASGYTQVIGTSAAAAHAAGVAALILQSSGEVDPAVVKTLIRNGAEPRGSRFDLLLDPTYNIRWGKGILDAFHSLPDDLGNPGVVWIANSGDDNAAAIVPDPSPTPSSALRPGSPHSIGGGREPVGIAVDGKGSVWLANRHSASVTKLNSAGQVRFHLSLGALLYGAHPDVDLGGVAADRENDAWLTLTTLDRVVQIRSNGTPDPTFYATGGAPVAVAVDQAGNVWVANSGTNDVTKRSASGVEAPGSPFAAGATPSAIACDRAGRAYVANLDDGTVTILESNGALVGHFPAGPSPAEIALDRGGSIWVANDLEATVTRLAPDGGSPTPFAIGAGPKGISVGGDGTLWISIYTAGIGNTVQRLSTYGGTLESVTVGLAPWNHGDGTGFVHASVVDPLGDADGDGWTNAVEIGAAVNPFDRSEHPVDITAVDPPSGGVAGGTIIRIEGRGLELPVSIEFGGRPAVVLGQFPGGVSVLSPAGDFPPVPVDVTASRPEGSFFTIPGAYQYTDDAPVADPDPDDPDDGYVVIVADSLVLDGTASTDPDSALGDSIVSHEWSVNGNAVVGATPTLSAATLASFGMAAPGTYPLSLTVKDSLGETGSSSTVVVVVDPSAKPFLRADANQDNHLNIADVIFSVQWQFVGGSTPDCLDAANANADGRINIADPIFTANYLFLGGPPPPPPFPICNLAPPVLGCTASQCP